MTNKDIFEIDNWLSEEECQSIEHFVLDWPNEPKIYSYGRFPDQLIANQREHVYDPTDVLGTILKPKLDQLFENYHVAEVVYQELHLPWDIHCDHNRDNCHGRPWQSVLIPFENLDCSTVIFEQTWAGNHFWQYKQTAEKVSEPVDLDFWNNRLDHCWPEDREFLTLKYVSKGWSRGNLLSFPRNQLHSSDNFHRRISHPKTFLQVLLDQDI